MVYIKDEKFDFWLVKILLSGIATAQKMCVCACMVYIQDYKDDMIYIQSYKNLSYRELTGTWNVDIKGLRGFTVLWEYQYQERHSNSGCN